MNNQILWHCLFVGICAGSILACPSTATGVPSAADVAAYSAEQIACVEENGSRATIDMCRNISRAAFCVRWPGVDGRCPDGGQ